MTEFYEVLLSGSLRSTHYPHLHSLSVFSESPAILGLFGARRLSQHNLFLPFPSPEKVASLGVQRIPQTNDFVATSPDEWVAKSMDRLIHRSAWNRNSRKFAFWAFSEVEVPLYRVLRSSPQAYATGT